MEGSFPEASIDAEVDLLCLVYQARQNNADALLEVFQLFRPELLAMARSVPAFELDDLLQDAFLRIQYCVIHYVPSAGGFARYVRASLARFVRTYRKPLTTRCTRLEGAGYAYNRQPVYNHQPIDTINGHEAVDDSQLDRLELSDLLHSLPGEDRQLVESYIGDRTISEIAAISGRPVNQVSAKLASIFAKMREAFQ